MNAQGGGGKSKPVIHTIPLNDVFTAAIGAFGISTALYHRKVSTLPWRNLLTSTCPAENWNWPTYPRFAVSYITRSSGPRIYRCGQRQCQFGRHFSGCIRPFGCRTTASSFPLHKENSALVHPFRGYISATAHASHRGGKISLAYALLNAGIGQATTSTFLSNVSQWQRVLLS